MNNLVICFQLLDKLLEPPTLEQELELEKRIRWVREAATATELRDHCIKLERQNFHQQKLISNSLIECAKYKARVIAVTNKVKQKNIIQKLFNFR